MDKIEAKEILDNEIKKLRKLTYSDLCSKYLKKVHAFQIKGKSETDYTLEVEAFWDSKPKANLRVLVSIDDGGIRAFMPMTADFIIAPDGSFIGE